MTAIDDPAVLRSDHAADAKIIQIRPHLGVRGDRVLTWQGAHKLANVAAAQAHAKLSVDLSGPRVDVVGAIRCAEVELMWRPLPNLFGAFLNEPGSVPGIIINSELPRGARRHTAAHELGHAQLAHSTSVDDGSTIDTVFADEVDAIPPANRKRAWSDQEKAAEAFASWFLMPRRVVLSALRVLGVARPSNAHEVYQLSLLLGTSYRTTVRHLPNLRLATPANCTTWARVAPGALKARLDRGAVPPASRASEVWTLTERHDGLTVVLEPGDRIVPDAALGSVDDLPAWLTPVPVASGAGTSGVLEVGPVEAPERASLKNRTHTWSIHLAVELPPLGLDPRRAP